MNKPLHVVTGWNTAKIRTIHGTVKGYALTGDTAGLLAVIATVGPDKRLEELLTQYTSCDPYYTARALMRDLLNREDYRSAIYDNIVRVYYPEDMVNV